MATLTITQDEDFSLQSLLDIDVIRFTVNAAAIFGSNQFGASGISNSVLISDPSVFNSENRIIINIEGSSIFTAIGWRFENWNGFYSNFAGEVRDLIFINGSAENNRIVGSNVSDVISGGDGNDVLDGGLEADRLLGGNGDDILRSLSGNT